MELLTKLGFFINVEKSVTTPCSTLEHLGFILDSVTMTVSLTEGKYVKLINKIDKVLGSDVSTIRAVASVIGSLVSYSTGVQYRELFYKQLEIEKIAALRAHFGNFDKLMRISSKARQDLRWWKENANKSPVHI